MKDGKLRITAPLKMTSLTSLITPMGGFPKGQGILYETSREGQEGIILFNLVRSFN